MGKSIEVFCLILMLTRIFEQGSNTMNSQIAFERLDRCIRAHYPIIAVESHEVGRGLSVIKAMAAKRNRIVAEWAITRKSFI
jgi:hypothetical protein